MGREGSDYFKIKHFIKKNCFFVSLCRYQFSTAVFTHYHTFSGNYIYYLTVFMGLESRHGLVWSSVQGFTSMHSNCQPFHGSTPELRILLPSLLRLLAELSSLWLWDWSPCFLASCQIGTLSTPRGHPEFLAMRPYTQLTAWMVAFFQVRRSSFSDFLCLWTLNLF